MPSDITFTHTLTNGTTADASQVMDNFNDVKDITNIPDTALASPNNPAWRVIHQDTNHFTSAHTSGTYLLDLDGTPSGNGGIPRGGFYFDASHYTVAGKTTKLRLTAHLICNAVAPGQTINAALYVLDSIGGSSGNVPTITVTTAVDTVAISGATAQAVTVASSTSISAPATGVYYPGFNFAGTLSAGFSGFLTIRTELRWV